jgi:hypothetical protein
MLILYSPKYHEIITVEEARDYYDIIRVTFDKGSKIGILFQKGVALMSIDDFVYLGFL